MSQVEDGPPTQRSAQLSPLPYGSHDLRKMKPERVTAAAFSLLAHAHRLCLSLLVKPGALPLRGFAKVQLMWSRSPH